MKSLLAALSLLASLAASPALHAQGAFDMGGLDEQSAVKLGTVQSVGVVEAERDTHPLDERSPEIRMQPDLTEQLLILLDEGDTVIVTVKGAQSFTAGQRVRVVSHIYSADGPRVEHE